MGKIQNLKDNAIMILSDLAFIKQVEDGKPLLYAYNLKNPRQYGKFVVGPKGLRFSTGNLSETNVYKATLIVERNEQRLLSYMR